MHREISQKTLIAVVVVALLIVGVFFYRSLAGPSPDSVEQDIQAVQRKMQLKLPGQPRSGSQSTTNPQPGNP